MHAGVDPANADHRSRPGFRQDRRTQLGAAARAARIRRHRHPGARRRVRASVSSERCWPTRTANRGHPDGAGDRHRRDLARWPACTGRGVCGCTTCAPPVDALKVLEAVGGDCMADRDRVARLDRSRTPRRVRSRTPRRPGLRRRHHGVDRPGDRGGQRRPCRHARLRHARSAGRRHRRRAAAQAHRDGRRRDRRRT